MEGNGFYYINPSHVMNESACSWKRERAKWLLHLTEHFLHATLEIWCFCLFGTVNCSAAGWRKWTVNTKRLINPLYLLLSPASVLCHDPSVSRGVTDLAVKGHRSADVSFQMSY